MQKNTFFKQTLLIKREISNQILSHLTIENMEMKMQQGLRHSAVQHKWYKRSTKVYAAHIEFMSIGLCEWK